MNELVEFVKNEVESNPEFAKLSQDSKVLIITLCSIIVVNASFKYILDHKEEIKSWIK